MESTKAMPNVNDRPTALREAVAQAYAVFGERPAPPFPLDVCLACCCPVHVERELREWPLARLMTHHFYEYNTAAKGSVQPVAEVKHLLPRLLELVAEGEDVHHSTELYLDRLGRCPADAWTSDERHVLDRFALACFDAVLCPDIRAMRAYWLDDPLAVLLMFDIGGIDIDPLLELWLRCEAPQSTIQFVEATYWNFWEHREYSNAFATERPAVRARLREWLLDPAHRQRFAAKMLAPAFLELVPHQSQVGRITFETMADGVFDRLAQ